MSEARIGAPTPNSVTPWPKGDLGDSRDYYTNLLHAYPAKMYREIGRSLLTSYPHKGDTVLDPFCGTGTVLMQARLYGMNAVGVDINPLAVLIAKVKATSLNARKLSRQTDAVFEAIENFDGDTALPEFPNIDFWFEKHVQEDLANILCCVRNVKNKRYRDFLSVCFSSIIRKVSNADPRISPPVKSKRMRQLMEKGRSLEVFSIFKEAVKKNQKRLERFCGDCDRSTNLRVRVGDSRRLSLEDESIDLVITSPPYVGAQKYVRSTRLEMLWLGLAGPVALREVDHDTLGSELVRVKEIHAEPIGVGLADGLIEMIQEVDRERAYMVQKYFIDMKQVLSEIWRVLRGGKRLVIVIGNNTVRGNKIPSSRILAEMAQEIGFTKERELVDPIRYRGLMKKRNRTAGIVESERILIFRK